MVDERVFISYGNADQDYAGRLAEYLAQAGIGTCYDADSVGQRVDAHIRKQINDCGAFIVVMTPESLSSERVNNELYLARSGAKPVLPILRGGEVFSTLREAEVFDATDGRLPDDVFLARVRAALAPESKLVSAGAPSDAGASHPAQEPVDSSLDTCHRPRRRHRPAMAGCHRSTPLLVSTRYRRPRRRSGSA